MSLACCCLLICFILEWREGFSQQTQARLADPVAYQEKVEARKRKFGDRGSGTHSVDHLHPLWLTTWAL